ncbi:MAG: AAA family ATPase, partial [Gemmatimonadota bacterium]
MSPTRAQDELPREFPLVGRKDELQRLFRIFGAGPTLRLLVGEGGVGKSRLADTLSREAARRDWRVLTARAYPVEQGVPYAVMAEALVPFLGGLEPATLTVLTRGREGDLRRLFPALDGEATKDATGPDSEELKTRLYWTLSTALEGLAQRQPTLLVVDDVHWSDPSSLSLLHFLVRHIESDAFRVVATCTAEHRTRNSHLIEVERSLESLRLLERTQLSPLGLGEIEELLTGVFDVSGAAVKDFADRLFGWTRGNAYFVEQTLRSLVDEGRLFRSNGTWLGWEARDLALPSTVRDAVTHRFGSLSRQAQDAAQHMAALGRPVRLEVLQEILGLEASELAGV